MDTPVSLLERLRRPGEGEAWSRFVQLYTPLLCAWARRLGLREPDVSDLVQDVLLRLVRELPGFRYDPRRSFRAWLCTVTLNVWRNRRRIEPPRAVNPAALDGLADSEVGGAELEEREYRHWLVGRAVQLMKADFQPSTWKACWECIVVGRPAAEVAAELGLSVGAVYMARARVLSRLRQELAGFLD